jgi:hypothetical protein
MTDHDEVRPNEDKFRPNTLTTNKNQRLVVFPVCEDPEKK